jgi:hypothetical protein
MLYGIVGNAFSSVRCPYGLWHKDGTAIDHTKYDDLRGLWSEPRKISGWVPVHESQEPLFKSRESAMKLGYYGEKPIAAIYVSGVENVGPEEQSGRKE